MQSLEKLRRSIDTAGELQSVVKTMKGMAAANVRRFEAAVESLADYTRALELGLQALLWDRAEALAPVRQATGERLGAVIFGSDQGMCGRFNSQIAEHAAAELERLGAGPDRRSVLVVGTRILPLVEVAAIEIDDRISPPSSLAGITPFVEEILVRVEAWRSQDAVDRVMLFHNRSLGGAVYEPATHQLYPVDAEWLEALRGREWPSNRLPIHTAGWPQLLASFVREYLYIGIFRAAAESLASENASRLASMQAAERNIEERLDALNMRYRLERQEAITEELLDISSGFEALS